jgi:hypothetical protein
MNREFVFMVTIAQFERARVFRKILTGIPDAKQSKKITGSSFPVPQP